MNVALVVEHARRVTGRAFAARDVVVGERHGFFVVRLAGDLMAYVAKDEAARAALATERRVLARVAQRVSFRVPKPIGAVELAGAIDLRERVAGATGARFHERLAREPALALRVANWMGDVLAELHDALAPSELDALGAARPAWPHRLDRLRAGIDAHLEGDARAAAIAVAEAWHARADDPRRHVLVHGDFGSHNFAFDEATGMPVGVFDFHDAGRAPRADDWKLLPSYGDEALEAALRSYAARLRVRARPRAGHEDEDEDAIPTRAAIRLAHAVTALAYLAWRADDPDAHDRGSGRGRAEAVAWACDAVRRCRASPP